MARAQAPVPTEDITRAILVLRGQRVLLDAELSALYGVAPKVLLQAVKRNRKRFPADFMMQLNAAEWAALRSQSVTSKGGRRYLPYAFTQEGVSMLSTVLNSDRAVEVSIAIMRTFVRIRALSAVHRELAAKVIEHEGKLIKHDRALREVFDAIRQLMDVPLPNPKKRRIGF